RSELGLEVLVALQAIPTQAEDVASAGSKVGMQRPEIARLVGATGGVVLGVKIDDDLAPAQRGQGDGVAASGRQAEVWGGGGAHWVSCWDRGVRCNPWPSDAGIVAGPRAHSRLADGDKRVNIILRARYRSVSAHRPGFSARRAGRGRLRAPRRRGCW